MVEPLLPYGRQSIDDADIAAVVAALKSDWLTQGPTIAHFEAGLAAACGARHAVAVANGTAALHLACLAAGVRPGDTGITSTVTFVASANAIRYAGGTPSLIDVDADTALISPALVERQIDQLRAAGTLPKVIIPVDFAGAVSDLPALRRLADSCGALLIEDAAHSLGATYADDETDLPAANGRHAQMAILSFHPVKHITTAEGGAITTNDDALYQELIDLRTHGITRDPSRLRANEGPWWYEQQTLGFNYRLSDLHAALGMSQLTKLPGFVERRRQLAARYDHALAAPDLAARLRPLTVRAGTRSSYHLYVIRLRGREGEPLESLAVHRRAVFEALRARGIGVQVHYIPVHRQPDYVDAGLGIGEFPCANAYYSGCISLPMFPAMRDADVDRVVEALRQVLQS